MTIASTSGSRRRVRSLAAAGAVASLLVALGCATSPGSGGDDAGGGSGGAGNRGGGSGGAAAGGSGGSSSGSGGAGGSVGGSGGSGGSADAGGGMCNAPPFVAGDPYTTGSKVTYMGKVYIAKQDNPGHVPATSPFFWELYAPCNSGGGTGGAAGTGGAGGSGGAGGTGGVPAGPSPFEMVVTEAMFTQMFPNRAAFYTFQGLAQASRAFPMFAGAGDMTVRKQEAAAFLANAAHETGNLVKIEEDNKDVYCQVTFNCECEAGKRYYGRGPLQLTWNYNYCLAGLQLGLNLRADPDLAARDAKVAYQTALWFWMTQNGAGTMTPHAAMATGRGFGETIRSLNGARECNGGNPGQVQSRVSSYTRFVGILGVPPGANTGC